MVIGRDAPTLLNRFYWAVLPLLAAVNGFFVFRLLRAEARRRSVARHGGLPRVVSVHFQIPVYLYYTAGLSLASLLWLAPRVSPLAARVSVAVALVLAATGVTFMPASRRHGALGLLRGERARDAAVGAAAQQPQDRPRRRTTVRSARRDHSSRSTSGRGDLRGAEQRRVVFIAERQNRFRFYNTALGVRSDAELAPSSGRCETIHQAW